jgi:hypothetical protein
MSSVELNYLGDLKNAFNFCLIKFKVVNISKDYIVFVSVVAIGHVLICYA